MSTPTNQKESGETITEYQELDRKHQKLVNVIKLYFASKNDYLSTKPRDNKKLRKMLAIEGSVKELIDPKPSQELKVKNYL